MINYFWTVVISITIHRHFYGFLLGQKTDHRNDDDHKHDGGDHKNDGGFENQILTFFSRHILLNTRMKKNKSQNLIKYVFTKKEES